MKRSTFHHLKRFTASKVFECYLCHKPIEIGSPYFRMLAKYKYCKCCYVKLTYAAGYVLDSKGQFIEQYAATARLKSKDVQALLIRRFLPDCAEMLMV